MNKSNSSEEKELPLYKETEVRVPIHLKITLILSILVDTFISKISLPMQPVPEIGSISVA